VLVECGSYCRVSLSIRILFFLAVFVPHLAVAKVKIVVLGTGIVNSQGMTVEEFWKNFETGTPSIAPIRGFPLEENDPFRVAAEVPKSDFALMQGLAACPQVLLRRSRKDQSLTSMKRQDLFAVWAANEARERAFFDRASQKWKKHPEGERAGSIIGATLGGPIRGGAANGRMLANYQHCSTSAVTYALGLDNFSFSISGACASGLQAIIAGATSLKADMADVMYLGASDAQTTRDAVESRNGILSRANLSQPFDQSAKGIVIGEGAGVIVTSTEHHATANGYLPIATIEGFSSLLGGEDTDVPDPAFVSKVLLNALANAGIPLEEINGDNTALLAHGPGNPKGDIPELKGIQLALGEDARRIPIVSLASWIGHPLGPAGAFRAVAAVEILKQRWVFGNLNLNKRHDGFDKLILPGPDGLSLPNVKYVIVLSLGLGGNYACVVFGHYV
jgi:3-oxoacyl-[acyl-carrier-protein] synthase II